MNPLLTPKQVAKLLSCTPSTIYSWVAGGTIPYYKIGRLIRFKLEDIEGWLEELRKDTSLPVIKPKINTLKTSSCDVNDVIRKAIDEVKENAV